MTRFWARVLVVLIVAFVIEGGITHYSLWRGQSEIRATVRQQNQDRAQRAADRTAEAQDACERENRTNLGIRTYITDQLPSLSSPDLSPGLRAFVTKRLNDARVQFPTQDCSKLK